MSDGTGLVLLAAVGAAAAVALAVPPRVGGPAPPAAGPPAPRDDRVRRLAPLWCASAALGVGTFLSGPLAWPAAAAAAVGLWVLLRRAEPAEARRRRARLVRELPAFVELFGAALASGSGPATALGAARAALPGAAADELAPVAARLELGLDAGEVWTRLAADSPGLAPLARVMARSHEAGMVVTDAVAALAEELDEQARARVEDRARAVGVRAAVPLGLCLLPAFLLLGIVPLVAAAVEGLRW
ncbi:type II secretion system F family protein [Nocardioides zeae]|uniref:Flp pilus assembly protein TadB n=1 Tax=Nocardioides zeae TaxID=1457234 RepID=A0AAJ1U1B8_9ACTN|nr:type II secretion system F family protein [Nocardioides zeae]MDQ1105554.1 Flp pilus assembly protein TadB [Nocardioides zeae]